MDSGGPGGPGGWRLDGPTSGAYRTSTGRSKPPGNGKARHPKQDDGRESTSLAERVESVDHLDVQRLWGGHVCGSGHQASGTGSWRTIAIMALPSTTCSGTALQCGQVNSAATVSVSLRRNGVWSSDAAQAFRPSVLCGRDPHRRNTPWSAPPRRTKKVNAAGERRPPSVDIRWADVRLSVLRRSCWVRWSLHRPVL